MRTDETATARYLWRGDVTKLRLSSTTRERQKFIFVTVALYMKLNKGFRNGTLKLNCRSLCSVILYRRFSATTCDLTA